jgi:hypothetical protein
MDHRTIAFEGLDESARRYGGQASSVPTLARILGEAEAARAANADRVEITLDAVDGHPTEILIDYRVKAIDDEACYRITDYSVDT